MKKKNKRRAFFANKMHKDLFTLVFFASIIPAAIAMVCLYYLIFNITAEEIAIPEAIAYHLFPAAKKVIFILLFAVPISVFAIMIFAYKLSHRIAGPFDRIVRELDECIRDKRTGHILIRKADRFGPLVDRINQLLDKASG